ATRSSLSPWAAGWVSGSTRRDEGVHSAPRRLLRDRARGAAQAHLHGVRGPVRARMRRRDLHPDGETPDRSEGRGMPMRRVGRLRVVAATVLQFGIAAGVLLMIE